MNKVCNIIMGVLLHTLICGAYIGHAYSQPDSAFIQVPIHQSLVHHLSQRAHKVAVTQPEIAEVIVMTPTQLLLNGKAVGTTSLILWDDRGTVNRFAVQVTPDSNGLRQQILALFPDERQIEVSTSGAAIILKGQVSNEVVYDKVLELAQTYLPPKPKEESITTTPSQAITISAPEARLPQTGTAFAGGGQLAFREERAITDAGRWANRREIPGVIDMLTIGDFRQIQLNVTVAEVSLTKIRELGLDFSVFGKHLAFRSNAGSQAGFSGGGLLQDVTPGGITFGDATSAIFSYASGSVVLHSLYRLFDNKDVTEILAQPKLVIKNGRSGGFLAGGEFPFPVPQASGGIGGGNTITIEFKPFGVRLDFVPTITWSNTIDLRVFPEVSEIDPAASLQISNITIPGLRVRRSVTRLEMRPGELLIMSGLLDRRTIKDLTKFPFLGDIPLLGTLFRSTRFRDQETELMFVISPTLVTPSPAGTHVALPSVQQHSHVDLNQVPRMPKLSTSPAPPATAPTPLPPASAAPEATIP